MGEGWKRAVKAARATRVTKKPKKVSKGEAQFLLHCRAYDLEPVAEVGFMQGRKWRFDFIFPGKWAIEIEGGTWVNGRHNRASSIEADMEKYNEAAILGWKVLRFTTGQVMSGMAIDTVLRAIAPEKRIFP